MANYGRELRIGAGADIRRKEKVTEFAKKKTKKVLEKAEVMLRKV